MDKIYVIIPVFDGWPQTKLCLDALRASTYRNLEIIVVNHGTSDEIKEALPIHYPEVLQIFGEPTLWWAGATNLGIRAALNRDAKTLILLNYDCYVAPDTIQRLAAHTDGASEAIIAPLPLDYASKRVLAVTARTCFLLGFPTLIPPARTSYLEGSKLLPTRLILGGRGVLMPASVFECVGMLDEVNLPHYYADHDFYLRCRAKGIPLFVAPDARVYIDATRTSLAADLDQMGFQQFLQTLTVPRSHRNVRDLTTLFRLHYPVKGLHHLGVGLHLFRYVALYAWRRLSHMV